MSEEETEAEPPETVETDNAADDGAIIKRQRRAKRNKDEAGEFWRSVFASEVGRREMWGVLAALHTFETPFMIGPNGFPQPEATWFRAGEQAAGMRLYHSWMRMARADVMTMHDECDAWFETKKKG